MSAWEASGRSDEWYTPKHIFDALGVRFDLDVAAPARRTHVPCDGAFCSDSLTSTWSGFVWMNPPFGGRNGLEPWLAKFFDHGNGIALTPDRTSAPWWQAAWRRADLALFTDGKPKFVRPDGSVGKSPGHGVTLWASGKQGRLALVRASAAGLGALAMPIRSADA